MPGSTRPASPRRSDRSPSSSGCGTGSPTAGRSASGASPVEHDATAARARSADRGSAPPTAAPACTGGPTRRRPRAAVPVSTIRPRYITATRSLMWRTTDRSWAMNRNPRSSSAAQPLEQADDLGLDADVERRHRLVEHEQVGTDGERPGDADALALAARELVRVARAGVGRQLHEVEQLGDALALGRRQIRAPATARPAARRRSSAGSATPAGPGTPSGSGAASCAAPRLAARPARSRRRRIEPVSGSTMRRTQRAVVLLPHPDSPTRLSVSPRSTSKDTSDTACTTPVDRRRNWPRRANVLTRSGRRAASWLRHLVVQWRGG